MMIGAIRRHYRFILACFGLLAVGLPARLSVDTLAFHAVLATGYLSFAVALLFGLAGFYRAATRQPVYSYRLCMGLWALALIVHVLIRVNSVRWM